jgi:uncharacterized Zn finger protein (UPF0148 family)
MKDNIIYCQHCGTPVERLNNGKTECPKCGAILKETNNK